MTMPKSKDPRDSRQWRALRIRILQRDGYTCGYCGQTADTVDHILPVDKHPDQAMSQDNLIAACKRCNSSKGSRSHASFLGGAFAPPVFSNSFSPKTAVQVVQGPCMGQPSQDFN
jgi:5-methylcytosine-specific restriction endonuclease McrA